LVVRAPNAVFQQFRMPLYEFRCPTGHDFEKFYRSIGTASAEEKCPVCGKIGVRLMSAAGFAFKGSGFYITDYGKDGKKAEREAASSAASAASAATAKADKAASSESSAKPESSTSESKAGASDAAPAKSTETAAKPAPAPAPVESKPAAPKAPKANSGKTK